jgi:hypothetical protein
VLKFQFMDVERGFAAIYCHTGLDIFSFLPSWLPS